MKYIPNLIPPQFRVLPEYFQTPKAQPLKRNSFYALLGWFFGSVFIVAALICIKHPVMTPLLALPGIVCLPPVHSWLERLFRFRFTSLIKIVFIVAILVISSPLALSYFKQDKKEALELAVQIRKKEKEKEELEKINKQKRDSLNYYLEVCRDFRSKHKIDKATQNLDKAQSFTVEVADNDPISKERTEIGLLTTLTTIRSGKYKVAVEELTSLIKEDSKNAGLFYNRAVCYNKLSKVQEAVNDLRAAMSMGNGEAEKLYEKINPVKKKVVGYVTRCCDGTTSSASGRGACSHHGGVCNWNDPIYEEYRKY